MGLDSNGTKFLLYAKSLGVDYAKTAMIGRQALYLRAADLRKNFQRFGVAPEEETIRAIFLRDQGYADEFLRQLGAEQVESFDYSAYEGATYLQDMNRPIDQRFKGIYSVVLDGGSLEHVFNFPTAIKNCLEMVRVGGHYLAITPTNNFMGHGFYQFSPELYFSILNEENGYDVVTLLACEDDYNATWFAVKSPREVKGRVTLVNSVPVYLLLVAKRVCDRPILQAIPQQSDYVSTWGHTGTPHATGIRAAWTWNSVLELLRRHLPTPVKKHGRRLTYYLGRSFHPRFFEPIKW